ncbi:MAG: hypothetical protein O3B73_17410 [bacterium]|nr:hypothetical protein [bacterium]
MYYEVYNLTPDGFGRTHYRIDYVFTRQNASLVGTRILGGLGKLQGHTSRTGGVTSSYEHSGVSEWEQTYVGLDVTTVEKTGIELTVVVTDLNAPAIGQASKALHFLVVDPAVDKPRQVEE